MPAYYRVRRPTLVLSMEDGKPALLRLAAGTILRVKQETPSGKEVECGLGRRRIRIFRIDLEERAELLSDECSTIT